MVQTRSLHSVQPDSNILMPVSHNETRSKLPHWCHRQSQIQHKIQLF